jgi:hypothetical protein
VDLDCDVAIPANVGVNPSLTITAMAAVRSSEGRRMSAADLPRGRAHAARALSGAHRAVRA